MRTVLLAIIIGFALPVFAQGTIDKHGRYIPTQEEIETNKRMADGLRSPTSITLRLVFLNPNTGETSDLAPAYKATDRIAVCVILNHYFSSPITIMESLNQYVDLQLELLRGGVIVPYKKEAQKQLDRALIEPPNGSAAPVQFLPGKDYTLRLIDLSDWYKRLLPGHYQLIVKRRFVWGGQWAQSDSIIFEIGPDTAEKASEGRAVTSRVITNN
jgi:hypothetical protein